MMSSLGTTEDDGPTDAADGRDKRILCLNAATLFPLSKRLWVNRQIEAVLLCSSNILTQNYPDLVSQEILS